MMMTVQKLHYEHLGSLLIRRDGLLHWKCPDCGGSGGSLTVQDTCPHCKNVKVKPLDATPSTTTKGMMMTKNEAREILTHHNLWRRGKEVNMIDMIKLGQAIDAVCEPSSIAQNIRAAAINWPQFLGDVECEIIDSFVGLYERANWRPNSVMFEDSINTARTFMLFVAEALE